MPVVLKSLPGGCQDGDIRRSLGHYGYDVIDIQMNYQLNQATVRLANSHDEMKLLQSGCVVINGTPTATAPEASFVAPYSSQPYGGYHSQHYGHQQSAGAAGTRVRVVVDGCNYPITKEVLSQVFSRVGTPLNIECGPSGLTTYGAVTFADPSTAHRAVAELNSKPIYPNCCTMTLTVEHAAPSAPQYVQGPYAPPPMTSDGYNGNYGGPRGGYGGPSPYRGRGRGMGGIGAPGHHNMQHHQHHGHHSMHGMHHHHHHAMSQGLHSHHHHHHHQAAYGGYPPSGEAVVIVSNVPETIPLHNLWVLLEVYGNVNSLKRQYSHKENVVAQFQNPQDAHSVVILLQGCPFYGSTLNLKQFAGYVERGASKVEWNSGPATDAAVTAVLFNNQHHRTKPSAPFNPKQKNRPDKVLFISNLTAEITDENVTELFTSKGYAVDGYYRKNPGTAIVGLTSVEVAVEALVAIHAMNVQSRYISVAFSRFPPGPPPPMGTSTGEGAAAAPLAPESQQNEEQ